MTNDRAIEVLKAWDLNYQDEFTAHEFDEAFRMAIKALEQQSEDAISRQAVLDKKELVELEDGQSFYCISPEDVETLPSVTSQSKTGHWIEGQTDNPNIHNILCSCCFEGYPSKGHANSQYTKEKFQWCPKCGARMIEPQAEGEEV